MSSKEVWVDICNRLGGVGFTKSAPDKKNSSKLVFLEIMNEILIFNIAEFKKIKIYLVCRSGVFDAWSDADGTFDSLEAWFYDPRIYGSRLPLCFLWYFGGRTRFSLHSSTKGHIGFSRRTACEVWFSELINTIFNRIGVFSVKKTFTGSRVIWSNKWVCIRSNKGGSIRSLFFGTIRSHLFFWFWKWLAIRSNNFQIYPKTRGYKVLQGLCVQPYNHQLLYFCTPFFQRRDIVSNFLTVPDNGRCANLA